MLWNNIACVLATACTGEKKQYLDSWACAKPWTLPFNLFLETLCIYYISHNYAILQLIPHRFNRLMLHISERQICWYWKKQNRRSFKKSPYQSTVILAKSHQVLARLPAAVREKESGGNRAYTNLRGAVNRKIVSRSFKKHGFQQTPWN